MSIVLTTGRLVIREFSVQDGPFVARLLNTPGWLKHIGDRQVKTTEDAVAYLERTIFPSYRANGFGFWLVELREGRSPIGMCGVYKRDHLEFPDIGYALLPEYERQGYAAEAAVATLHHGREKLGFKTVCAIVTPANLPSIRLLEKIGFTYRQPLEDPTEKDVLSLYVLE